MSLLYKRWLRRFGGLSLIVAGFALILSITLLNERIIGLLEDFVSPDGLIIPITRRQILIDSLLVGGLGIWIGWKLFQRKDREYSPGGGEVLHLFLSDPVCGTETADQRSRWFVGSAGLIGLVLTILYFTNIYGAFGQSIELDSLYVEDGLLESLTALLYFGAFVLMAMSTARLWKTGPNRWVIIISGLVALLFLFVGMEEISWGQRLVGWSTPELFLRNVQGETNLHNFFNPYFAIIYQMVAIMIFGLQLASIRYLGVTEDPFPLRVLLPHPGMVGLAFLIALLGYMPELIEELIAVFAFFYSLRVLVCLRRRGNPDTMVIP